MKGAFIIHTLRLFSSIMLFRSQIVNCLGFFVMLDFEMFYRRQKTEQGAELHNVDLVMFTLVIGFYSIVWASVEDYI